MSPDLNHVVLANTQRNVGVVIAVVVVLGFVAYWIFNTRRARPELGSEIELAPNRKEYYPDGDLEGRVLDRALLWGLLTMIVVAIGLPLYWLGEPGRQSGAEQGFEDRAIDRGAELFATTEAGGLNCAGCHGPEGVGGVAPHTLTAADGDFIAQVEWKAPALNTVLLRYSEEEVREILVFGRGFSPMPAWGLEGGGPLNEQQIDNLIAYLTSIQIPSETAMEEVTMELERSLDDGEFESEGEALYNMGLTSSFAGGAYSCGRCHTLGWSYGEPDVEGGGALGPNLTGGSEVRQFPDIGSHIVFVTEGSVRGQAYGTGGQGSGAMPGFGRLYTADQIDAVVRYERGL